ncbi:MAG: radical SAM protein [Bacillota bacterium]|nr:radical SAM protein [Bacillota bacterium]
MNRYSSISRKNPREIILLRGTGCRWKKCTFCDYHTDSSGDEAANERLNFDVMKNVTGVYGRLEVINSGSFPELGKNTLNGLVSLCREKKIRTLHFECHYLYRKEVPGWRRIFADAGVELKIKTGVETFDYDFREKVLKKGIPVREPAAIAEGFDECCLMFGISGQTAEGMTYDIETGLKYFERVCVNMFNENSTEIKPDRKVSEEFEKCVMPLYENNPRVDILLNNTDFGVGNGGAVK